MFSPRKSFSPTERVKQQLQADSAAFGTDPEANQIKPSGGLLLRDTASNKSARFFVPVPVVEEATVTSTPDTDVTSTVTTPRSGAGSL